MRSKKTGNAQNTSSRKNPPCCKHVAAEIKYRKFRRKPPPPAEVPESEDPDVHGYNSIPLLGPLPTRDGGYKGVRKMSHVKLGGLSVDSWRENNKSSFLSPSPRQKFPTPRTLLPKHSKPPDSLMIPGDKGKAKESESDAAERERTEKEEMRRRRDAATEERQEELQDLLDEAVQLRTVQERNLVNSRIREARIAQLIASINSENVDSDEMESALAEVQRELLSTKPEVVKSMEDFAEDVPVGMKRRRIASGSSTTAEKILVKRERHGKMVTEEWVLRESRKSIH